MSIIEGAIKEVFDHTEWVAIVTSGEKPHIVATWGDFIRELGIEEDTIVIPAGAYNKTEENLKSNSSIQLFIASKDVNGSYGPGQGCVIEGEGRIDTDGVTARKVQEKYEWARGALIIKVKTAKTQR